MADALEPPVEGGEPLVEPPIIDSLYFDPQRKEWSLVFVPEDTVSNREKESISISLYSPEGKRVQLRMTRLNRLLGGSIERLFHAGDGRFTFHMADGQIQNIDDAHNRLDISMRVFVELADIAMTAQIAFVSLHASATG